MKGSIFFLPIVYLILAAPGSTAVETHAAERVDADALVVGLKASASSASSASSLRTPLLRQRQTAAVPAANLTTSTWLQRQRRQEEQIENRTKWGTFFEKRPLLAFFLYMFGAAIAFVLFIVVTIVIPFQILVWVCNGYFAAAAARADSDADSQDQRDQILAQMLRSGYCVYSSRPKSDHDETLSVSTASSSTGESTDATIDCDEMVDVEL